MHADFHTDATIALPKAGTPGHVEQPRSALDLPLTPQDMAALDRASPPPKRKAALEMI
jgi:diketogulonate reductase-like aldo/keto reductase